MWLNLLPAAGKLQESGLALCPKVQDLLEGCELPDLPSSLLLPGDMALHNLPPLRAAHRHFNFDTDRLLLSALEEVRISFLMPEALLLDLAAKQGLRVGAGGRHPPIRTGSMSVAAVNPSSLSHLGFLSFVVDVLPQVWSW